MAVSLSCLLYFAFMFALLALFSRFGDVCLGGPG